MSDSIRAQRLLMTKAQLVDTIELTQQDYDDLRNHVNDFIDKLPKDNNQVIFEAILEFWRTESWDIPSALGSVCSHFLDGTGFDFFLHRNDGWDNDWAVIDDHFKSIHGLDLSSPSINWSFDT